MLKRSLKGYLDPNSGSMFLYAIIGILATLLYTFKGFYYKIFELISGGLVKQNIFEDDIDFIFHSEGYKYWHVFEPIIAELSEEDNFKMVYLTVEENKNYPNYKNLIIKAFANEIQLIAFMNKAKAKMVVSTTPQLDVYMLKRSNQVKHYTHIMHSPANITLYQKHAFDYYDSVFCTSKYQIEHIRLLEQKRKTKPKKLFETGCTYYDLHKQANKKTINNKMQVLYAPSWGEDGSLAKYGEEILNTLLQDSELEIIFRPHPQVYISQKQLIENITKKYSNLIIDNEADNQTSILNSDILISDYSGIIFDYAFLTDKPIIMIKSEINLGKYEGYDLENAPYIEEKFGTIIEAEKIKNLNVLIKNSIKNNVNNREEIRQEYLYNFGQGGKIAAQQLKKLLQELS